MGLGQFFTRNLQYDVTDTKTGFSDQFTIVTDGIGSYPDWSYGAYEGAMGLPGVWRAAMLVAEKIGSLPWDAYRERAGKPVEKLATPPLLDRPNPNETRMSTFSGWALDLLMHGNAFGVIAARDRLGYPTAITPVEAQFVSVGRVKPQDNIALPTGSIYYLVGDQIFAPDEIIHVKGPAAPGCLRGMGVLENHFNPLRLAQDLEHQARSVSTSGVPTGLLKVTNSDATTDNLKTTKTLWEESQRTRGVAVLGPSMDFVPLAWSPSDSQLVEARKFSLVQIAHMFQLDPYWLGVSGDSNTYANTEMKSIDLVKFSLSGHLARFEQTLTQQLPAGTYVKANLDALLRGDTQSRYVAYQTAIAAGFLTVDEVRALEDMAPLASPASPKGTN